MSIRRHHEELAAASSIWPALSLLVPFTATLWARIRAAQKVERKAEESATPGGDL